MSSHTSIVVDMLIGFALIEAIVKPLAVRATQYVLRYLDSHVNWIPDWLYYPIKND